MLCRCSCPKPENLHGMSVRGPVRPDTFCTSTRRLFAIHLFWGVTRLGGGSSPQDNGRLGDLPPGIGFWCEILGPKCRSRSSYPYGLTTDTARPTTHIARTCVCTRRVRFCGSRACFCRRKAGKSRCTDHRHRTKPDTSCADPGSCDIGGRRGLANLGLKSDSSDLKCGPPRILPSAGCIGRSFLQALGGNRGHHPSDLPRGQVR